jgi:hypothetical protein
MDFDKIFGTFDSSSEESKNDSEVTTFVDFQDTPVYFVGMFRKLILNHKNFHKKLQQFLRSTDKEMADMSLEEAGEFVVYSRSWYYINKIDLSLSSHKDCLRTHSDEYLISCVKLSISFWEECEEYEKCAHLKKIQDFLELSVPL